MKKIRLALIILAAFTLIFGGLTTQAHASISSVDVTTPGVFTSPTGSDSFTGGQTITVSWGHSTSTGSWGVVYFLYYYDGSSWITVAKRLYSTSYDYTLPDVTNNAAQFKVYAAASSIGDESGSSGYRYSDVFNVTQTNAAPGIPGEFTHPAGGETVAQGDTMNVAWAQAIDPNGDEVKYELSVFNGADWSVVSDVQSVNAAQTTQSVSVPSIVTTDAKYRVRAYDGEFYSDYRTSNAFVVAAPTPTPSPSPTPTPTPTPTPSPAPTTPIPEQKVGLSGILEDDGGSTLAGYAVELRSTPREVVTDASGRFYFDNVTLEDHTLIVKDKAGTALATYGLKLTQGDEFAWADDGSGNVDVVVNQSIITVSVDITVPEEGNVSIDRIEGQSNPKTGDNGVPWWLIIMLISAVSIGVGAIIRSGSKIKDD